MYCVALYIGYRCMSCVVYRVYVYAFVVSHVVCRCMSCDVHCVHIFVVLYMQVYVLCRVVHAGVGVCVVYQV